MRSPASELLEGHFRETIDDAGVPDRSAVRRIVLASGKVSHDAIAARDEAAAPVAVVRVDQLYPWPYDQLDEIVAGYPNAKDIVWLQEEPENMGAWSFVKGRLYERFDDTHAILRVSRYESGSPATGSHAVHAQEQAQLLARALEV
jgi:2-oxoglutarate dehydrogenase E1 component